MRRTFSFLLVTGAVALAACSSSKNNSAGGTCSNYSAAIRENGQRCNRNSLPAEQEAAAAARLATLCTNALNAPGNGIATSAIDTCAAAIRSTCDTPEECKALQGAVGTLPDGTACGADAQCAGGDCRKDPGGTSCGKCAQRIAVGAPCGSGTGKCVAGASCATKGTTGVCTASVDAGEGEVCYDPKASSSFTHCASGLTCKTTGGGTDVVRCTKRGGAGEACAESEDCITELTCIQGKCATLLPAGAACTSTSDCAAGTACATATKKCVAVEYGPAGAVCNDAEKRCARGTCDFTGDRETGKCVDPIADGAPCKAVSDSAGGPRCDTYASCVSGTCQLFDPATCK